VSEPRSLPEPSPEWAEWWEATRERRLLVQQCTGCGRYQHYPRALCVHCGHGELAYREAAGTGTIYSFTVVHRAAGPAAPPVPYVVALVRLAEGPVVLTNVLADDPGALACDAPVTLAWEPLADGRSLPVFAPA
jgi:uncharacterized OB-fold protein